MGDQTLPLQCRMALLVAMAKTSLPEFPQMLNRG